MASKTNKDRPQAPARAAEIVREYRPFAGADHVHRVTCDGRRAWAATGAGLVAFDPESGEPTRTLDYACDAGTAFDGRYLCQIAEAHIDLIDPATSNVVASIPAYHVMFGPEYTAGCPTCSTIADGFVDHLANHDVTLCATRGNETLCEIWPPARRRRLRRHDEYDKD